MNLSGNAVSSVWVDGPYVYKKQIKYLADNAWDALTLLRDTHFVPTAERLDDETIRMRYIKDDEQFNPGMVKDSCKNFLYLLQDRGLRHGDLTVPHIFIVDNHIVVIDWAESRVLCDRRPDKRPEGDEYWLWRSIATKIKSFGYSID